MPIYQFFATTPKAMEDILADELRSLGAEKVKPTTAGAYFEGSLETAYRACLWSRIANRVLLQLSTFKVASQDDLYKWVQKLDWFEHLKPEGSFAATMFFADIEGHPSERRVQLAMEELGFFSTELKVLGTYRASPFRKQMSERSA